MGPSIGNGECTNHCILLQSCYATPDHCHFTAVHAQTKTHSLQDVWPAWLHSVTVYTDAHNEHSSDFAQPGGTLLVEYRELSSKEASSNTRCPGEDTTATSGVCMADLQRLSHSTMHVNGTLEIVQKRAGGGMHFVQAVHVAELVATLLKSQSQLQSAADAEAETDDAGAGAAESTADAGFQGMATVHTCCAVS